MSAHNSNKYICPTKLYDATWMSDQAILQNVFSDISKPALLTFSQCEWLDLQPMIDLFLQISEFSSGGGRTVIQISSDKKKTLTRAHRFLKESGFLSGLRKYTNVRIIVDGTEMSIDDYFEYEKKKSFDSRELDFETIVPCQLIDIGKLSAREDVYKYCHDLREEYLAKGKDKQFGRGKSKSLRLPAPLIQELKFFFNSVLAELIDNVRLHKPNSKSKFAAIYMRYRSRVAHNRYKLAEPPGSELTKFKKLTSYFWQHDFIESVFADIGESIQDSYSSSWERKKHYPTEKPRMNGKRVDGPNADAIILENIFENSNSSLSEDERKKENLPLNLTGLYTLRQTISHANWCFSVNSGLSYVIIGKINELNQKGQEAEEMLQEPVTKRGGRGTDKYRGVHYFFRFASLEGRPLDSWADGTAGRDITSNHSWWDDSILWDYEKILFTSHYKVPDEAGKGKVIICRANNMPNKNKLYEFLEDIKVTGANVIFAEISPASALYLSLQINMLMKHEGLQIICPILTNTMRDFIPGDGNNELLRSFNTELYSKVDRGKEWWVGEGSPIHTVKDIFNVCRDYDSKIFWSTALNDDMAFIREPIIWNEGQVLIGGFLSLRVALRKPLLLKLIRKRALITSHALRVKDLSPLDNSMRYLTGEVKQGLFPSDIQTSKTAILGNVLVTGKTAQHIIGEQYGKNPTYLPVFKYPEEKIETKDGRNPGIKTPMVRVLNWGNKIDIRFDRADYEKHKKNYYHRIGTSERISRKPEKKVDYFSFQKPETAYRVWQTHSLINIGHYSYERYHYFIWLDMFGFINSRTSDSINMIGEFAKQINALSPSFIVYCPNEDSELLVHTLIQYAQDNKLGGIPSDDNILPVSSIQGHLFIGTKDMDDVIAERLSRYDKDTNVVFLDDAMVTGSTIKEVRRYLKGRGFNNIHSFVLLDRIHAGIEFQGKSGVDLNHFSYWSMSIPPTGTDQTCPICRGIEHIQILANRTMSNTIRDNLIKWKDIWAKTGTLDHFENRLQRNWLDKEIMKKLGDPKTPNIILKTSEALCTWVYDMMAKLDYFTYLFDFDKAEERRKTLAICLTEVVSGMIFMFWGRLNSQDQQTAMKILVGQMWAEPRESARALISVAVSSLRLRDIKIIANYVKEKILEEGLPHFDAALFAYIVFQLNARRGQTNTLYENEITECLQQLPASGGDENLDRTKSLLTALAHVDKPAKAYHSALLNIGFPGRGIRHYYIYAIIQRLIEENRPAALCQELIAELSCLLDPVRKAIAEYEYLFKNEGVISDLNELFAKFDQLIISHMAPIAGSVVNDPDQLIDILTDVDRFLSIDIREHRNVRALLGMEFIHFLPFRIRSEIKMLSDEKTSVSKDGTQIVIEISDFDLKPDPNTDEKALIRTMSKPKSIGFPYEYSKQLYEYHTKLQEYDVIYISYGDLHAILRDILMDVVHPKRNSTKPNNKAYMTIRCGTETDDQSNDYYCAYFENIASDEEYRLSEGRSWDFIRVRMEQHNGKASFEYNKDTGILRRTLKFQYSKASIKQKEHTYEQ